MLVLSRKLGERIYINDNITVTVSEIRGGSVRIGIDAPKSVKIMREEVVRPLEVTQHTKEDERELARYFKRHEKE